jgi:hypothetical protein
MKSAVKEFGRIWFANGKGRMSRSEKRTDGSVPLSIKEVHASAAKTFVREARSPAFRRSVRLVFAAGVLPLCYTLLLSLAALSPEALSLRQNWITALQPLTDAIAEILPRVKWIAAELVLRDFAGRAPMVSHVVAAQWLLFAPSMTIAAIVMLPERAKLRRAFAAAQRERRRLRPNSTDWLAWFTVALAAALLLWLPFDGHSYGEGRDPYDLATSDTGLFWPHLATTWARWSSLYYVWLRLLATLAPSNSDEYDTVIRTD